MRFGISNVLRNLLIAAVGLLSLLPASAMAQDARGKFTLTTQVHWGKVVLPPGDYRYSLENRAGNAVLMVWNTAGAPGFLVLPASVSRAAGNEMNRLDLQRRGNQWFVSSLVMPEVETAIHFRVPPLESEVARGNPAHKTISMVSP
jgi:hypothetical protein